MSQTPFELFISNLQTMKHELQQFHDTHKDSPKRGFDEEHEEALRSGLKRIRFILNLLQGIDRLEYEPHQEWFEHENTFLESYHEESIDNYYHALMNMKAIFRSMGDLWHKIKTQDDYDAEIRRAKDNRLSEE